MEDAFPGADADLLDDDRVPWVAEMKRLARSGVSFGRWNIKKVPETAEFPDVERAEIASRVLGYLRSVPETADGEFELPIVTVGMRARRG